jgi:hypothetical protein
MLLNNQQFNLSTLSNMIVDELIMHSILRIDIFLQFQNDLSNTIAIFSNLTMALSSISSTCL